MVERVVYNKFNRGEVDSKALVRGDVEKIQNSASLMENWLPERLGSMTYRPGTQYLGEIAGPAYFVPFVAATNDTALIEFTNNSARVWIDDVVVSYTAVSATVTNGDFLTGLSPGWTDASTGPYPIEYDSAQYVYMFSDTFTPQILRTSAAITETTSEHCLKIVTLHGRVTLRLGTTLSGSDIIETELLPGTHYIAFTPNASTLYIEFRTRRTETVWIDSCQFYSGTLELPTPVIEADLGTIRYAQSADVLFITSQYERVQRISRRGTRSWSIENFLFFDGPMAFTNNTNVKLYRSVGSGAYLEQSITLNSDVDFFDPGHVGSLFRVFFPFPASLRVLYSQNTFTPSIKVTGDSATSRQVNIAFGAGFTGEIYLQRSFVSGDDYDDWSTVANYVLTGAASSPTYSDGYTNVDVYYRLYVNSVTSGSTRAQISALGSNAQSYTDVRVLEYVSRTSVLVSFIDKSYVGIPVASIKTENWYESEWSDYRGWPTSVELHEGRLWLAGRNKLWASESDIYDGFDTFAEGDAAAIAKTIGFGPVNSVEWAKSVNRLILGTASDEISARSNSFGEVLTPTNINLKSDSTQGSDAQDAVKVDQSLYFVQRSKTRIYESSYAGVNDAQAGIDITTLHPTICSEGIKRIAVTRQPETRIYVVMDDGTARAYTVDKAENVAAWSRLSTTGTYEDVVILPGLEEDRVYFVVNRNGQYNLEKQALASECIGGSISKHLDSFVSYTSPGTLLTGLEHLEGLEVTVWADGIQLTQQTVNTGTVVIAGGYTNVTAGLQYTATYGSNKIREYIGAVTSNLNKRVTNIAFVMQNVLPSGIRYGDTSSPTQKLPLIENGKSFNHDVVVADYEELPVEFDGVYDVDARIYLTASAPATVLSLMIEVDDPNYTPAKQG